MRRLGAILVFLGANMAVGSAAAAFWRASFDCALTAEGDTCPEGTLGVFVGLMFSGDGLVYWGIIVVGLLVLWRGKRLWARKE